MATANPTPARGASAPDPFEPTDRRGYPRRGWITPGRHEGRPNRARGRKFPADPPTPQEIIATLGHFPPTAAGRRDSALTILLWRSAIRIECEALRLTEHDLDPQRGSIIVRAGKGGKTRTVGMDAWAWREITPWLEERRKYPVGELFCVVDGPTKGRAVAYSQARKSLQQAAQRAQVRRRMAPHQLRHAWTLEAVREGMPLPIIMRQLGHANLAVTTKYIAGLSHDEVIDTVYDRPAPTLPVSRLLTV